MDSPVTSRSIEDRGSGTTAVKAAGLASGLSTVLAAGYAVAAILGHVAMTMPIFVAWLALLYLMNLAFLKLFWDARDRFGIGAKLLMLLWGGLFLWYWLPAPIYYFMNMNLDALQFRWVAFAWIWEVPAVGGGMHVAACYRLSRPIRDFVESRGVVRDPARLYRAVLRYPCVVGVCMVIVSVIGYLIGAVQFRLFAHMPLIEQCKSVTNGVTVSVFLSVIYYLVLDHFLSPVRARLEQEHGLTDVVQRRITRRILGVTLLTTFGSIALISLFVLQSFQIVTREHVARQLQASLEGLAARWPSLNGPAQQAAAMREARLGRRGQVTLLNAGEHLISAEVSPETKQFIVTQAAGVTQDLKKDVKMVACSTEPVHGKKLVSIAYLTDFYGPLPVLARFFGVCCLYVVILTVGIITIMSIVSTRAIGLLSAAVRQAVKSNTPYTMHIHSADEIEELSHAFAYFASESEGLRQNLEEKVRELARSNADLEQFAYIASHDLQEPLRTVASYSQLLARRYQGRLDPEADEYIHFAVEGVTRMYALINDLLEYSRVDTRGRPFEPIDASVIIEQVIENLRQAIQESGAVITHAELPMVVADASQLRQVFQNLISNALKFHRQGVPPRIDITAQWRAAEWVFTVRDNGIGIDPQYAGRLFVLFQRLHPQADYPGTGIGLAVCKKIIERHGGTIGVESTPGQGASFWFTLPAQGPWLSKGQPVDGAADAATSRVMSRPAPRSTGKGRAG